MFKMCYLIQLASSLQFGDLREFIGFFELFSVRRVEKIQ